MRRRRPATCHLSRCAPVFLAVCLVLAWAASPARARGEWYDFYDEAIQALDRGEPDHAIEMLQRALSLKDRPGYFRTYGNNYIRYLPHFYLGVAHHDAGNCEMAIESFQVSESSGETDSLPALAGRMRSLRTACEAVLAPPAIAPQEPGAESSVDPEELPATEPEPADPRRGMLEEGLRAYLRGDLEGAVNMFERLTRDSPQTAYFRLLLGTALYGSWLVGGESDQALIRKARTELSEAARLDPGLVPDPRLCPPRVVALYRSLR
jgi:tetratricopeptide (TPR) repeat protein